MAHDKVPRWLVAAREADPSFHFPPRARPYWVERVLTQSGKLPARELGAALQSGRVRVAERVVTDPLQLIAPGETLLLDGEPVPLDPETVALMFHKPARTVVTTRSPRRQRTVFDVLLPLLPVELGRYEWHAVGRLDRDTTGLLLFTNDARLIAHVCRPEQHLPKRYVAEVRRAPSQAQLEPLRAGIVLQDGPCRPAEVRLREGRQVELTITEGRRHQVRRMLDAVGLRVDRLHRESVGGVTLDVPTGCWRRLTLPELRDGLRFSPS